MTSGQETEDLFLQPRSTHGAIKEKDSNSLQQYRMIKNDICGYLCVVFPNQILKWWLNQFK